LQLPAASAALKELLLAFERQSCNRRNRVSQPSEKLSTSTLTQTTCERGPNKRLQQTIPTASHRYLQQLSTHTIPLREGALQAVSLQYEQDHPLRGAPRHPFEASALRRAQKSDASLSHPRPPRTS